MPDRLTAMCCFPTGSGPDLCDIVFGQGYIIVILSRIKEQLVAFVDAVVSHSIGYGGKVGFGFGIGV